MIDNILEIKDLFVEYRTTDGVVKAVNGINLSIERGLTTGIVGETGAGKTTTGLAIQRLIPDPPGIITSGKILLNDEDILKISEKQMETIRGNKISMIFQDPMTSLNPVMTVEEQIAEGIAFHQKLNRDLSLKRAQEMLELVGIPASRGKEYPHQFSGGMRQRVVIAIALACEPSLLIADEPTTALDVTIQAQVIDLMIKLKQNSDMSMIMITHDLGIVAETCDNVAIMYAGQIIEYGTIRQVFEWRKHPYTEGLFQSIPHIGHREKKLKPIKGLMPDPTNLPSGCPFWPRCDFAMDVCHNAMPPEYGGVDGYFVRCYLYKPTTEED